MLHFTTSLKDETCILLYPWVFKDEEGHKRDKISSPPYMDLIENILPGNYTVCQEFRKRLDEETLSKMFFEVNSTDLKFKQINIVTIYYNIIQSLTGK